MHREFPHCTMVRKARGDGDQPGTICSDLHFQVIWPPEASGDR